MGSNTRSPKLMPWLDWYAVSYRWDRLLHLLEASSHQEMAWEVEGAVGVAAPVAHPTSPLLMCTTTPAAAEAFTPLVWVQKCIHSTKYTQCICSTNNMQSIEIRLLPCVSKQHKTCLETCDHAHM